MARAPRGRSFGWSIILAVTRRNRSSIRRFRLFRTPAVAGQFYPSDPGDLDRTLADLIQTAPGRSPEPAVAILAPHAGYIYSGRIAGAVYGRITVPPRIVLMGPNHTGMGPALSLWDGGEWRMPGGEVALDRDLGHALQRHCPLLVSDRAAHLREHCLEVQIPFLRARAPNLRITPVVVGTSRLSQLRDLGAAVARAIRESGESVLLVLSSDMTHYEAAETVRRRDEPALAAMERVDPEALHHAVSREAITMCGFAPAVAGLFAARDLGAGSGKLVLYGHSGEVTGNLDSVVAYAGMIFS
jgi:MEMO1 family protein